MVHHFLRVAEPVDWDVYHDIRRSALWDERGRTGYNAKLPGEYLSNHHSLLLKFDGRGIGTTRVDDCGDGTGVIRLVAITADMRGRGHGRVLSTMVDDYARSLGIRTLLVSAACDAEGFYSAMGWHRCRENYDHLLGVADDCIQMQKAIGS